MPGMRLGLATFSSLLRVRPGPKEVPSSPLGPQLTGGCEGHNRLSQYPPCPGPQGGEGRLACSVLSWAKSWEPAVASSSGPTAHSTVWPRGGTPGNQLGSESALPAQPSLGQLGSQRLTGWVLLRHPFSR